MDKQQIYTRALEVMEENFGHITEMCLASSAENIVSARDVNAYYREGKFYVLGKTTNTLFHDIERNPNVGLCHGSHNMQGVARSVGHPLDARQCRVAQNFEERVFSQLRRVRCGIQPRHAHCGNHPHQGGNVHKVSPLRDRLCRKNSRP